MKQSPKIALIGYGRMGQEIHRAITARNWPEPCIVDPKNERVYESVDDLIGRGVQVCIEFTAPDQAARNIISCLEAGLPVVSGTTGWEQDRDDVRRAIQRLDGACVHANNFSIGVFLFHRIVSFAATLISDFPQFDIALHEVHHAAKKDFPSGTALSLAQALLRATTTKDSIETALPSGPVNPRSLYVTAARIGAIVGEHHVMADSSTDTIELIHRAKGREGFAEGALLAAQWIMDKKGMFTLEDMIHDRTKP
jgi:4-hydroxy-tetrahydrodipicolinate reductase